MEFITAVTIAEVTFVVGGVLGYYLGHRGIAGVESDLQDVKTDIANIKGKLTPTPVITPIAPIQPVAPIQVASVS